MTKIELKDLCKQYQIPSSNINKRKLIERIKQTQNQINNQGNLYPIDIFYSLTIHIGPMV